MVGPLSRPRRPFWGPLEAILVTSCMGALSRFLVLNFDLDYRHFVLSNQSKVFFYVTLSTNSLFQLHSVSL